MHIQSQNHRRGLRAFIDDLVTDTNLNTWGFQLRGSKVLGDRRQHDNQGARRLPFLTPRFSASSANKPVFLSRDADGE
jgi:hypothetical protein